MCLGGGGSPSYPAPKTAAQLAAETDNPFKNPDSGEELPSWKPQQIAEAKKKKDQLLATEKAKADAQSVIKAQQSEKYG